MNNHYDISVLATEAFANKKDDYVSALFWSGMGPLFTFVACFNLKEQRFSVMSGIIFATITLALAYNVIRLTRSFYKCKKNFLIQNYVYYHIEIDKIRAGARYSLWADFKLNGKEYSEPVNDYKIKYFHVFDCGGEIVCIADSIATA